MRVSALFVSASIASLFAALSTRDAHAEQPDATTNESAVAQRAIDRTWLYGDDARIAAPLAVVGSTQASFASTGAATREGTPFPYTYRAFNGNTAQPGGMIAVGAELGLLPRLSIAATGDVGFGGDSPAPSAGMQVGARLRLTPSSWEHLRAVASGGYVREMREGPVYDDDAKTWTPGNPNGANGAWAQLAVAGDIGRLRLAGSVHAEHVFSGGRDPVDMMVTAGASYGIAGGLRAGVEYVGQDLEEAGSPDAEGGVRHFVGPTIATQLLHERLTIALGPSVGLSDTTPRLLARGAVAYAF
jgi:hypothetical protein